MVRLHVKGTRDDESFDYMCEPTASISMLTRDIAAIYALRLACLDFPDIGKPLCTNTPPFQNEEVLNKVTQSNGMAEDSVANNEPRAPESIRSSLSCCSEADASTRIQLASLALGKILGPLGEGKVPNDPQKLIHGDGVEHPKMWCCGKLLCTTSGKSSLRDLIALNDNSTLTVYIRSSKDGPPPRHNGIDSATYRNMVALYHKREEDLKHLREEDEVSRDRDQCLSAAWANPKQLKRSLVGNGGTINYSFYIDRLMRGYCNEYDHGNSNLHYNTLRQHS